MYVLNVREIEYDLENIRCSQIRLFIPRNGETLHTLAAVNHRER